MPKEAEDRHEAVLRSVIAQHKTTARDTAVEVVFLAAELLCRSLYAGTFMPELIQFREQCSEEGYGGAGRSKGYVGAVRCGEYGAGSTVG